MSLDSTIRFKPSPRLLQDLVDFQEQLPNQDKALNSLFKEVKPLFAASKVHCQRPGALNPWMARAYLLSEAIMELPDEGLKDRWRNFIDARNLKKVPVFYEHAQTSILNFPLCAKICHENWCADYEIHVLERNNALEVSRLITAIKNIDPRTTGSAPSKKVLKTLLSAEKTHCFYAASSLGQILAYSYGIDVQVPLDDNTTARTRFAMSWSRDPEYPEWYFRKEFLERELQLEEAKAEDQRCDFMVSRAHVDTIGDAVLDAYIQKRNISTEQFDIPSYDGYPAKSSVARLPWVHKEAPAPSYEASWNEVLKYCIKEGGRARFVYEHLKYSLKHSSLANFFRRH